MSKVLMVDDDPTVLSDNCQYFEALGYNVICVENAGKAQNIVFSAALDCIVLDVESQVGVGTTFTIRLPLSQG